MMLLVPSAMVSLAVWMVAPSCGQNRIPGATSFPQLGQDCATGGILSPHETRAAPSPRWGAGMGCDVTRDCVGQVFERQVINVRVERRRAHGLRTIVRQECAKCLETDPIDQTF